MILPDPFRFFGIQDRTIKLIAPGIAFDEYGVTCRQQFGAQVRIMGKLLPDERFHNHQTHIKPVRAAFDPPSHLLRAAGCFRVQDTRPLIHIVRFRSLESMFDRRIGQPIHLNRGGIEIGQEVVVAAKRSDRFSHLFDRTQPPQVIQDDFFPGRTGLNRHIMDTPA